LYAAVGALSGVVAGQPPWRKGAWLASILKAVFGAGVGAGLYALASRFLAVGVGGIAGLADGTALANAPLLFAPLVAGVYGMLVELDDGGEQPVEQSTGVRVSADSPARDVLDQAPAEQAQKREKKAAR
jgi:hypothetical protein